MTELSYDDSKQGWAWNSRMFAACRARGLNPCDPSDLKTFFDMAADAARTAHVPVIGRNHHIGYVDSLREMMPDRRAQRRERCHITGQFRLPAPQPVIPSHVRWYVDVVFEPFNLYAFVKKFFDFVTLFIHSRPERMPRFA